MSTLQRLSYRMWFATAGSMALAQKALAGEGSFGGDIPAIPGTPDAASGDGVRQIILDVLTFVLNFLALIAVVFVIIAGIRLIVSQGDEGQKDKAKKTILYVIIGLIVILFARVIVGFFASNPFDTL